MLRNCKISLHELLKASACTKKLQNLLKALESLTRFPKCTSELPKALKNPASAKT